MLLHNSAQGEVESFGGSTPTATLGSVGFQDAIYFFRRRWQLIGKVTGVCLAIAAAFVVTAVPEFTASAQILFNPPRDKTSGPEGAISDAPLDPSAVDSQISLIRSAALLQRVVEQERLTEDPELANGPTESVLTRVRRILGLAPEPEPINVRTLQALQERLNVERAGKTYVISISVTSSDREKAMRLTSAVANSYIADRLAARAAVSERSVRLINPPTTPTAPSYPKTALIFALALLGGLVLAIGTAITIEVTTAGFTTPGQVEAALGVPVLAVLGKLTGEPGVPRKKKKIVAFLARAGVPPNEVKQSILADGVTSPAHLLLANPFAGFSEAFRTLRFSIQAICRGEPPKIIQVTSCAPGEGRTTVALCLAISAAASGLRVAFVDFDVRGATTTKSPVLEQSPGLVDVLRGTATLPGALRFDPKTGIHVLAVGRRTNGPVELKAAQVTTLLEPLRAEFDYVVIDSPPLGPVTDAAILASLADEIVLVLKWNDTPQEIAQRAVRQLFDDSERLCAVLNFIDQRQAPKYDRHVYAQFRSSSYQSPAAM